MEKLKWNKFDDKNSKLQIWVPLHMHMLYTKVADVDIYEW